MAGKLLELDLDARVSIRQAAELLGVTPQWIRDLGKQGYIDGIERASVPLMAAVQGFIKFRADDDRRTSKTAAASAVQQARAREIELRIARESGKVIELEDTETAFANILGALRSELAGVPAASTRDLALREVIDGHLNDAIARARDRFREFISSLRAGGNRGVDD